jgi:predicted NAD/FAD-binding protein
VVALLRGLTRARGLGWADRLALLVAASGWAARGFRCDPSWTVDHLCRSLPAPVRALLIDPLCVAALNTPANAASASVFLRVLHDALLSGPGSADLLLPRRPLGELLPQPALQWLAAQGAHLEFGHRVMDLTRTGPRWRVDDRCFDRVILACSANEAARLARGQATAAWLDAAETMPYEPIVTVFLEAPGARLPTPMMALMEGDDAPAQFVFDHGSISGQVGRLTCVVSGARRWVDAGLDATAAAVLGQAQRELAPWLGSAPVRVVQTIAEKRATFRCTPCLPRPEAWVAPGLMACGDYVQGPYPATLEGAVRAGEAAAAALNDAHQADARMRRP